jgi:putative ATP-binding cassette transporter
MGEPSLRDLVRLAAHYWNCERRGKVRAATSLLLLLTVAQVGLAAWVNYWNRALFDALEQRATHAVLVQVGIFAAIFLASIAVTAVHLIVKRWLQLDWRAWATERVLSRWMERGRHYRLLAMPGEHDNPDQRIAEDVRIATETAIALAHTLVYSLLTLVLFIDILWSVSGAIAIPGTHIEVPGYLVPLAFLYAGAGSVLGWGFGRPLVRTTNALQSAEATFRFGLSRERDHSEQIALMQGEPIERAGSALRFRQIVREWNRQSLAYMGLVSFSTGYGLLLPVFPILVAAPQYIAGAMSLGVLMQAAQAFQRLTSALSWPVDSMGDIARCRASADRVMSLYDDLQRLDTQVSAADAPLISLERAGSGFSVEDLTIAESSGHVLVEHLDVTIHRGERVLVTGEPAVTDSLFKVAGGLWPWGSGRVSLPERDKLLFLPQHPFLPEGTLRGAISYPSSLTAFPDAAVMRALESVDLAWLASRLEDQDNWQQALPLGTQQRVAIARALLHRPDWLFMMEATSALEPDAEQRIFALLERELPQVTLVTFSMQPALRPLHTRELVLTRMRETKILFERRRASAQPS